MNSIQRAQQQQTSSLIPPPANLFQEQNQLHTPPPQYLPASPSQPAPVTAPLQPQPGPSNQLPEMQELQELIDIASDSEDHTWSSSLVGDINSILDASQLSTESPCHRGFLYNESKKARGHLLQVLFDTGSIINVIPISVANLIGADYDLINSDDLDFTSCTESQINILGKTQLNVIFNDKIVRNFPAYISENIADIIISFPQMISWGLTEKQFPFKGIHINK